MKKILLITLLSLATMANAQTTKPIEGFLGIKFGSTKAQVITAMKAKGAVIWEKSNEAILFKNISLGKRKAYMVMVDFFKNKATGAIFCFKPSVEAKAIDEFNHLKEDFTNVYGEGTEQNNFKAPYEDGDGYEITAIKTGNARYRTEWNNGDGFIGIEASNG